MKTRYSKEHLLKDLQKPQEKNTFLEVLEVTLNTSITPDGIDWKLKKFFETTELSELENFFNNITKEGNSGAFLYAIHVLAENNEFQKNEIIVSCIKTLMCNKIFVEIVIVDRGYGYQDSWLYPKAKKNLEEKKVVLDMFSNKNMAPYSPTIFTLCSQSFQNDSEIVKSAITSIIDGGRSWHLKIIFKNMGKTLKQNNDFILTILDIQNLLKNVDSESLAFLLQDTKFSSNSDVIKRLLINVREEELSKWILPIGFDEFTQLKKTLQKIVKDDLKISQFLPKEISQYTDFIMSIIDSNNECIDHLPLHTKIPDLLQTSWGGNKNLLIKICFRFPEEFQKKIFPYLMPKLKNDIEFLSTLVKLNPKLMDDYLLHLFEYATPLIEKKEEIIKPVEKNKAIIETLLTTFYKPAPKDANYQLAWEIRCEKKVIHCSSSLEKTLQLKDLINQRSKKTYQIMAVKQNKSNENENKDIGEFTEEKSFLGLNDPQDKVIENELIKQLSAVFMSQSLKK